MRPSGTSNLLDKAGEAAGLLTALSNEHRLLVLCHLVAQGELSVSAMAQRVGLSQSALSQHLGKLRQHGLVSTRKEAQTVFYSVCDPRAAKVLQLLQEIFCPELDAGGTSGKSPMAPATAGPDHSGKGE